jgi:MraZ protein
VDGSKNDQTNTTAETPERTGKTRPARFIGSFNHSLDTKGRLVIPQTFRDKLGETFCVAPSFDFRSIAIYPTEKWEERNETYEKLGKLNPALNRYLEQFYALSYDEQTCDGQGRVLLPVNIRQKILREERDMEITGANDHVRVAALSTSDDAWKSFNDELPQLLELIAGLETQKE